MSLNVRENEGATLSRKKGIQAANLLVEEKVDVVLAGSLGEGPFHVLGEQPHTDLFSSKSYRNQRGNSPSESKLIRKNGYAN